jgi:hypothetical protein
MDTEIIVRAQVLFNEKLYNINLTDIISDRAFEEISELVEHKLTRRTI